MEKQTGLVSNGLQTYEVVWLEEDLASIEQEGDSLLEFCSKESGGFISLDDVLDQALDVVLNWDDVDVDVDDWEDFLV